MSPRVIPPADQWEGFKGYVSDALNAPLDMLAPPSINCMIDENGVACQRLGYLVESDIDLEEANKPATSFYLERYDVTVFAVGGKVKYFDWTTREVYDTGATLTDGTITRGDAFSGDVYLTNTTDGLRRLVFGRLNDAAATLGDAGVTVDADMAARLARFSITSGNLVIQGTAEAFHNPAYPYSSVSATADNGSGLIRITTSGNHYLTTGEQVLIAEVGGTTEANGTWTVTVIDATRFDLQGSTFSNAWTSGGSVTHIISGMVKLDTTLSKSYSDNAVCVVVSDISTGREKASKVLFWTNRMTLIGSTTVTNADQPNATVFFGQFPDPDTLEDIIDFTYGSQGATREMVGRWGAVTNAVPAKDYLYLFKESQAFSIAEGDVVTSGSNIGESIPQEGDLNNGCINEDSACVMGDNEIAYPGSNKRIMRIKFATDSGAPVLFPDEGFDRPIRKDLARMDDDQTGARAFYHKGSRRAIFQLRCQGQWYWFIYDRTINGGRGGWQPPQQVLFAADFFERKGVLYCTDGNDDTVYSLWTSFADHQNSISSMIASANVALGKSEVLEAWLQGQITQPAIVRARCYVTNVRGGRQSGSEKRVLGSSFQYSDDHSVGADAVGEGGVEPVTVPYADWETSWDVFPSEANRAQILVAGDQEGGYYSISGFNMTITPSGSIPNNQ